MTATFETYKPTAFAFPALPDGLRWAGGWEGGEFTIEVHHGTHVVFLQRWDLDMCLAERFPTNAEAAIARAAQRAGVYAAALEATRRYMPPAVSDLWPLTPPPASRELR